MKTFSPFGVMPGTTNLWAFIEGNKIFWKRGYNDSSSGWDFTGIDLSDYDRVQVEIEKSDKNLNLILCDGKWKNWHCYGRISPTLYEVPLSGEGARWVDTDARPFDLKDGLMVMLQKQDEEFRTTETSTVIKSIRFLKKGEKGFDGGKLGIFNRAIGTIEDNSYVEDNTIIYNRINFFFSRFFYKITVYLSIIKIFYLVTQNTAVDRMIFQYNFKRITFYMACDRAK